MSPPESESCKNGVVAASVPPVVADDETMSQVAKENPQAADMVDRILRLLAAFSVVSCTVVVGGDGERRKAYGMTPAARYFVKDEEGMSMGEMLKLIQDKVFVESWRQLLEDGADFLFDFRHPIEEIGRSLETTLVSVIASKKILESYKGFDNINQLLDVGGSLGHNLQIILSKYPKIKDTNFDLPHVTKHGIVHPGVEHMGGDMFESIPSAEAILIKWILHGWDNNHYLKLLKNCHKAIPDNGKVIVVESIMFEEPKTTIEARALCEMDMMMMTQNPGGKERTKKEFLDLVEAAGFSGIKFECYVCNIWIMEFYKQTNCS